MHGLGIDRRDLIKSRQSSWSKEINDKMMNSPSKKFFGEPPNIVNNKFLNPSEILTPIHAEDANISFLKEKIAHLEESQKVLYKQIENLSTKLDRSLTLSSINVKPVNKQSLEHLIEESYKMDNLYSSDFSVIDNNSKKVYFPFYIKEDYTYKDNITYLDGKILDMKVNILTFTDENPIIYPFGLEKDIPLFFEQKIKLSMTDADERLIGDVIGKFYSEDDIYQIRITKFQTEGDASRIENYSLPLTIKCRYTLI